MPAGDISIEEARNLPALIRKYAVAGPRYTSYPTAVEFREDFGPKEWESALDAEKGLPAGSYSLYLHIPFCQYACLYCACNRIVPDDRALVGPYLEAVFKEFRSVRERLPLSISIDQIHWGGGSPNFLTCSEIEQAHRELLDCFPVPRSNTDVSVELDPRRTSTDQIETFAGLGFNRFSFGVQDFDPQVQALIGRRQSFEETSKLIESVRLLSPNGINIDLIYGLPGQTLSGFRKTIEQVIRIRPSRIALYGYAHVSWAYKMQQSFSADSLPGPETRIQLFLQSLELLLSAGYTYIGMDHFCLPEDGLFPALNEGRLNRNFMGYTNHKGSRVLGFGCSSISSLDSVYAQNMRAVGAYIECVSTCGLGTQRGIRRSVDDRMRWELIESIMCRSAISIAEFERRWGIDFSIAFSDSLQKLQAGAEDGLLILSAEEIRTTALGSLFLRNIAFAFDSYLEHHRGKNEAVFSKAV